MKRWGWMVLLAAGCNLCAPAGELKAGTNGAFRYACDLYSAALAPDGRWLSLQIAGRECLAPTQAVYLRGKDVRPLALAGPGRLTGQDADHTLAVAFSDSNIVVAAQSLTGESPIFYPVNMADHFRWLVSPAQQGNTFELPAAKLIRGDSARFVSGLGPALEISPRVDVTRAGGGRRAEVVLYASKKDQVVLTPKKEAPAADLVFLLYDAFPKNHFFPPGPPVLPLKISNQSREPMALNITGTLETFVINRTNVVLETVQQSVQAPKQAVTAISLPFSRKVAAGPYTFTIAVRQGAKILKRTQGVLIVDAEHWKLPETCPADFDAFWQRTLKEARAIPLDVEIKTEPTPGTPGEFREISFNGLGNRRVRGFIAFPKLKPGERAPARLGFPGAGYAAAPLDFAAVAKGWVVMSLSVHDLPFTKSRYHDSKYFDKTYNNIGNTNRDTYFFRYAYANAARAVDYLRSLPQVDPARILVEGGSQGGQLAIATAALVPDVALALAGVPGGSRLDQFLTTHRGWLTQEPPAGMSKQELFEKVLVYFDTGLLAERVRCPALVAVGMCDNVTIGPLQYYLYRNLTHSPDKRLAVDPWGGHGIDPVFVEKDQNELIRAYIGKEYAP